ncbi:MAG: macro domain-containing protein [Deltaproteobacteria bacterium]
MNTKILFVKGDVTEMAVDAIANPSSTELKSGAGVAGTILRKGGNRIQEECESLGRIALGETAVTTAGALKALYVVHAAVIRPGEKASPESIRLATHNTLLRAEEKALKNLAFPAFGTGAGGISSQESAQIMIGEVLEHLKSRTSLEKLYFVLFDDAALTAFEEVYNKLASHPPAHVA